MQHGVAIDRAQAKQIHKLLSAYKNVQEEKTAIYYLCQRKLDHRRGETDR